MRRTLARRTENWRAASRQSATIKVRRGASHAGLFNLKTVKFHRIYAHAGPDGVVRNIGVTHKDERVRLQEHLKEARRGVKNHRCNWLRRLASPPSVAVLEWVRPEHRADREKYWIALFRDYGHRLVNGTDGGDGAAGRPVSMETRKKISVTLAKRPRTRQGSYLYVHRRAIAEGLMGHKQAGASSGLRGVCWHARDRRWMAKVRLEGKNKYLGYFFTEEEAARAVDTCVRSLGLSTKLINFP